jgi:putative ABC transport system permease protein
VAGLFIRSFMQTRDTDPGFRREGVLLAAYDLSGRTSSPAFNRALAVRLLDRLRTLPGVDSAAIAASVPLDIHGLPSRVFTLEGRARTDEGFDEALTNTVTPGYFSTMGIPFRTGVDFAPLTDETAPPQAIVNEAFVRRYVVDGEVLGRRIQARGGRYLVVGVVGNSLSNAFGEPPTPVIYFSYRDSPQPRGEIHLHASGAADTAIGPEVRRVVRDLDPELPLFNVRSLTDHVETNLIFRRIPTRMFAVLGPLLLMLAAVGIYAVVAYTVSLRTTEIGLRLAVGATARRVVAQFVGQSMGVVGAGALTGWAIAFAGASGFVPDMGLDAAVFAGVPAILLGVAGLACWLPARRASRVDPVVALRQD